MKRRTYIRNSGIIVGGMLFPASIIALLDSCRNTDFNKDDSFLFTYKELNLVSELSEVIIPRTDTPGAKDVGVAEKIDLILHNNYEVEDQRSFISGLNQVKIYCRNKFNKNFKQLSQLEKEDVMFFLKQDALRKKDEIYKHFYPLLKGLTVISYFNSEIIGEQYLLYDAVPGIYLGDVPISGIDGVWSIE